MIDTIKFTLNVVTLCINLFTCLISFFIFISIIHYLYYNRMRQEDKVPVIHCINIYMLLLIYTAILFSFNIQTILGDLNRQNHFDSPWCIFMGYFSIVIFNMLYWSFCNQAFFRLCRIVYSTYRYFQYVWLYILMPPVELILICIWMSPVLFWRNIAYFPNEHYCYIPFTNLHGILWAAFVAYGGPLLLLSLIYLRITIFLHRQMNNQTLVVQQHQQRDLIIIRRILITVGLLMILGIPAIVLLIILYVTGEEQPFTYRIFWLFVSFSMIGLSLSQVIFTPQVKSILMKKFQHNQVGPLNGTVAASIPIRQNITTV